MLRRIRAEPARRLLELALAPRAVLALRVEPGDGHVHETLEEVAFLARGDPPLVLEFLVGIEVPPLADQLKPSTKAHHVRLSASAKGASVARVATILLVGVDLFFRGKLDGLLPGHRLVTSDSVDPPDLVIADIARVEPEEVVDAWPDIPILGYTNHTDKSGLQRAHTAGFDQVIVKSALVERAPELVAELSGSGVTDPS
jgi:hypothetical protein